jgi:hypothetical protein
MKQGLTVATKPNAGNGSIERTWLTFAHHTRCRYVQWARPSGHADDHYGLNEVRGGNWRAFFETPPSSAPSGGAEWRPYLPLKVNHSRMTMMLSMLSSLQTQGANITRDRSFCAVLHRDQISDCGVTDRCISVGKRRSALRRAHPIDSLGTEGFGITCGERETSIRYLRQNRLFGIHRFGGPAGSRFTKLAPIRDLALLLVRLF